MFHQYLFFLNPAPRPPPPPKKKKLYDLPLPLPLIHRNWQHVKFELQVSHSLFHTTISGAKYTVVHGKSTIINLFTGFQVTRMILKAKIKLHKKKFHVLSGPKWNMLLRY